MRHSKYHFFSRWSIAVIALNSCCVFFFSTAWWSAAWAVPKSQYLQVMLKVMREKLNFFSCLCWGSSPPPIYVKSWRKNYIFSAVCAGYRTSCLVFVWLSSEQDICITYICLELQSVILIAFAIVAHWSVIFAQKMKKMYGNFCPEGMDLTILFPIYMY